MFFLTVTYGMENAYNRRMSKKPFMKWLGGKRRLMPQILQLLPPGGRLVEPFVGGASVFMGTDYDDYLLADANCDLINVYKHLQRDGVKFINKCDKYFDDKYNNKSAYDDLKDEFNSSQDDEKRAILFVYINRHCFRGKCQYNKDGRINMSYGWQKKPYFPRDEMIAFHKKSNIAEFVCAPFEETMQSARPGDVIYCDPPYTPETGKNGFVEYTKNGFDIYDHESLVVLAEQAHMRGIPVLISNHDTKETRDLYSRATKISTIDVTRFFGRRQKASELLALYH